MALDGLGRRVARLETQIGAPGRPCEKCGQTGPPLEGEACERALSEAAQESREKPNVEEAYAQTIPCLACGRPRVLVVEVVRSGEPPPA